MRFLFSQCSFLIVLTMVFLLGCTGKAPESAVKDPQSELIARGQRIYRNNCTACHSPDPRVAGSLGPDIAKSSLELIEARVMRTEYPKDYKPKRSSHIMQPLPQLKEDIPALHAYLNSL